MQSRNLWIAVVSVVLMTASAQAAGLFRWVDQNGRVHYSDLVPPAAVQSGHAQLDAQGRVTHEVRGEREGTRANQDPASAAQKEQERARRERVNQDRALLSTYTNVDDIERLRGDRLATIDSQLRLVQSKLDKVTESLQDAEGKRQKLLAASKPAGGQLEDNIAEYQRQVATYQEQIATFNQRRAEINVKFDQDRVRFTELKAELDATPREPRRN